MFDQIAEVCVGALQVRPEPPTKLRRPEAMQTAPPGSPPMGFGVPGPPWPPPICRRPPRCLRIEWSKSGFGAPENGWLSFWFPFTQKTTLTSKTRHTSKWSFTLVRHHRNRARKPYKCPKRSFLPKRAFLEKPFHAKVAVYGASVPQTPGTWFGHVDAKLRSLAISKSM